MEMQKKEQIGDYNLLSFKLQCFLYALTQKYNPSKVFF